MKQICYEKMLLVIVLIRSNAKVTQVSAWWQYVKNSALHLAATCKIHGKLAEEKLNNDTVLGDYQVEMAN